MCTIGRKSDEHAGRAQQPSAAPERPLQSLDAVRAHIVSTKQRQRAPRRSCPPGRGCPQWGGARASSDSVAGRPIEIPRGFNARNPVSQEDLVPLLSERRAVVRVVDAESIEVPLERFDGGRAAFDPVGDVALRAGTSGTREKPISARVARPMWQRASAAEYRAAGARQAQRQSG